MKYHSFCWKYFLQILLISWDNYNRHQLQWKIHYICLAIYQILIHINCLYTKNCVAVIGVAHEVDVAISAGILTFASDRISAKIILLNQKQTVSPELNLVKQNNQNFDLNLIIGDRQLWRCISYYWPFLTLKDMCHQCQKWSPQAISHYLSCCKMIIELSEMTANRRNRRNASS